MTKRRLIGCIRNLKPIVYRSLVGKKTQSGKFRNGYTQFFGIVSCPANELASVIKNALEESSHLIVICSPNSAKSKWVNEEIKYFKQLGRSGNIFCFIIGGIPNISETGRPDPQECFPDAVRYEIDKDGNLTSNPIEPIAADCRDERDGKKNAIIKLIAGLIGVGFDQLKQRDLAHQPKETSRAKYIFPRPGCDYVSLNFACTGTANRSREAKN